MSFRRMRDVSPLKEVKYNTPLAKKFLERYSDYVSVQLSDDLSYVPSKTFAPSSIRCKRQQWFRLRGTRPDVNTDPNVGLNFIASVGTHCHTRIQSQLSDMLKDDWLDVDSYLSEHDPGYKYSVSKNGFETRVSVVDPPVKFSVDGLIRFDDTVHLLEIKTSESISMRSLSIPKQEHLDQIVCYCTLLNLDDAIVLYQDRQYGSVKCFTYHVKQEDKDKMKETFVDVLDHVSRNIIPEALPVGDKWCNSSYCRYFATCRKWGV